MEKQISTLTISNIKFLYQNNTLLCYERNVDFTDNLLNLLLLSLNNDKKIYFLNLDLNNQNEELIKQWTKKNNIYLKIVNKKNDLVEELVLSKK